MKTKYLQAMGVTSWQLRQTAERVLCYRLPDGQVQGERVLLATVGSDHEHELLAAILIALGASVAEGGEELPVSVYICLGAQLTDGLEISSGAQIISAPALAAMLKNPCLKADLWRILSPVPSS